MDRQTSCTLFGHSRALVKSAISQELLRKSELRSIRTIPLESRENAFELLHYLAATCARDELRIHR